MLGVVMLGVVMLGVVMLGVVMLSVVAPFSVVISNVNKELIKDSLQAKPEKTRSCLIFHTRLNFKLDRFTAEHAKVLGIDAGTSTADCQAQVWLPFA
jgi:hypothetical protein